MSEKEEGLLTLVARNPCFGLPTGCPQSLAVYLYLRFAKLPFRLDFNSCFPDSDQIPYVEYGDFVAYSNEKGGIIESLKQDGIIDLDSEFQSVSEWIFAKAMVSSWLADAISFELWLGTDGNSAHKVYYSDLPWPIGKALFFKQIYSVKQKLGITKENAQQREEEIYRKANLAYGALSSRLGEHSFLFEDRPSSLDAYFLSHVLFTLQALPETSVLRSKLLEHSNLVKYAEKFMLELIESVPSTSSNSEASTSAPRKGRYTWSSKAKSKPKREKTEEEKTLRRRAKYFLGTQLVAVLLFLTLMGRGGDAEVEMDDDDEGYD